MFAEYADLDVHELTGTPENLNDLLARVRQAAGRTGGKLATGRPSAEKAL